jgi:hypothetical protein
MTNTNIIRKKQFKAALALAGMTAKEWAAVQGVTTKHVDEVVLGKRTSERLNTEIDAFIARPKAPRKSAA